MVPVVVIHHIVVVAKLPRGVDNLITHVYAILEAMTANTWFPTPSPSLSSVKSKVDDLKDAQVTAKTRIPGSCQARNVKKVSVVQAVYALRDYIQGICDANPDSAEAIALSGLFYVKKVSGRQKQVFTATNLRSGIIELVGHIKGNHCSHDWGMTLTPDNAASWYDTPIPSTLKSSTIVENLSPGTRMYFRHQLVTKEGPQGWDRVISIIIT
jgi:hypothetical protein